MLQAIQTCNNATMLAKHAATSRSVMNDRQRREAQHLRPDHGREDIKPVFRIYIWRANAMFHASH
ncbi:hypothetical protein [Chitinivorax sp. B]|uniref:hypothetical protein n=1 Tax=Chitinivorax sp. B TaxID=2502235 RepID=UPI0010F7824B|nr:hypothetical protein [Chitinivorax sp. B]